MDFILDGTIDLEVERISFPAVIFTSQAGNVSLSLEIDPISSILNLKNDFDVSFDKLCVPDKRFTVSDIHKHMYTFKTSSRSVALVFLGFLKKL